jgi:hypothetical protein
LKTSATPDDNAERFDAWAGLGEEDDSEDDPADTDQQPDAVARSSGEAGTTAPVKRVLSATSRPAPPPR